MVFRTHARRLTLSLPLLLCVPASAGVDLVLVPEQPAYAVGETVRVALRAVASGPEAESVGAIDMVFAWDPGVLVLVGLDQGGAVPLLSSGFPANDPFGLNESSPPADGDGLYTAFAPLGNPIDVPPGAEGVLITTFVFEAIAPAVETIVDVLESGGSPPVATTVFSGEEPNLDITGALIDASVTVHPACPGDLDGDGDIDFDDLGILLGAFGQDDAGDIDADGDTDFDDLGILLGVFGTQC